MTTYSIEDLAAQPIGFWSGEAYRRIAEALRESLAANGLSQPQWWALGRLEDTSREWSRQLLIDELTPYSAAEEGREVGQELDGLVAVGWASASGDTLTITPEGLERLKLAQRRNGETHQKTREGVSDAEYAGAIDVLRRMVGNLGGDSQLR